MRQILVAHSGKIDLSGENQVKKNAKGHSSCMIFEQHEDNEAWDEMEACYITKWNMFLSQVSSVFNKCDTQRYHQDRKCFRLSWQRETAPSRTHWSADALHVGSDVLGYLSLTIPVVIINGATTCWAIARHLDCHRETIMQQRQQRLQMSI